MQDGTCKEKNTDATECEKNGAEQKNGLDATVDCPSAKTAWPPMGTDAYCAMPCFFSRASEMAWSEKRLGRNIHIARGV